MLVRESISFQRGNDPKDMLGIGLHAAHEFTSMSEFINFLLLALSDIFEGEIPKDILTRHPRGTLPDEYYRQICKYLKKYNKTYRNRAGEIQYDFDATLSSFIQGWTRELRDKLIDMGYKK